MQNIQKEIETITDIRNKVSYDIKNIVFFLLFKYCNFNMWVQF